MKKIFVSILTVAFVLVGGGLVQTAEAMTQVYDEKGCVLQ